VTGYADQRPVASNNSEGGKAQNRRVEVLILPTTVRSNAMAPTIASPTRAAPAQKLSKDGPVGGQTQTQIDRRDAVTK
jgi:hypothetical protein